MSNNRLGRNPFDNKPKVIKAEKPSKPTKVLKTSNKKEAEQLVARPAVAAAIDAAVPNAATVAATIAATTTESASAKKRLKKAATKENEQLIGELIDLPEENLQPLTFVPSRFFIQIFARWI